MLAEQSTQAGWQAGKNTARTAAWLHYSPGLVQVSYIHAVHQHCTVLTAHLIDKTLYYVGMIDVIDQYNPIILYSTLSEKTDCRQTVTLYISYVRCKQ